MNEIYIKIEGLNLNRITQKLIDGGVFLSNLKIKKTYILFSINLKYKEKLDQICKREHKKYYIVQNTKIKRFFAKFPYCLGGFIPFVILFAFFYVIHNTIFSVNLICDSDKNFDLEKVNKLLLENNITIGAKRSNLSTKEIEKLILENATDVAGCTAYYDGLNLNIIVYPAIEKDENLKNDIISKYNAVITKIETFAGDQKVDCGDVVKTGDILIKNNKGAKGEVFGKVFFSSTRIYNEKHDIEKETGNQFQVSAYNLSNLFLIGTAPTCGYKNYKFEKTSQIVVKNLFIPVYKEIYLFKELVIVEEIVPFDDVEMKIKEELKSETLSKVPDGVEVLNVTYSVVKDGNFVRVDCFAETEMSLI